MTTQQCTRCAVLAELVQKQQAQIAHLHQVIAQARGACVNIASVAQETMKKGNLPRGVYAYRKSEKETAEKISKYLLE